MKRNGLSSLAGLLVLTLSMAISASGQARRIKPPAKQREKMIPVNISAKPDLRMDEAWLAKAGSSAANSPDVRLTGSVPLGGDIRLACRLTNAGFSLKIPFVVTYLIDGTVVGTEQFYGLAAGQASFSAVAYKAQGAGPHKLRCEIDRENKVVETTRDNNALEISFNVADGSNPQIEEDKPLNPPQSNETPLAAAAIGGALSPPEVPAAFNNGIVVVAALSTLISLRTADLTAIRSGSFDGDIQDQSTTVILSNGEPATFISTSAGTVYRVDPMDMSVVWQRTLRRAGCPNDQLTARPIVHLRNGASANFKATFETDLVYVATNYMASSNCASGHNTANRVIALQASDGFPVWIYNEDGQSGIDGITRVGSLDRAGDRLFIGTKRSSSAVQHSVWAIDVLSRSRVWSTNAGDIVNSPVPLDDRVLVASRSGLVSAIHRDTGALIWSLQVGQPPSPAIAAMTTSQIPNLGLAAFLVMASGRMRLVKDNGDSGEILWDMSLPAGKKAKSPIVYEPNSNMFYVGADDGQVYQANASNGVATANRVIDASGTGIVGPPFIWEAGGVVKLVAGSSKGTLAEFVLPWPIETFDP